MAKKAKSALSVAEQIEQYYQLDPNAAPGQRIDALVALYAQTRDEFVAAVAAKNDALADLTAKQETVTATRDSYNRVRTLLGELNIGTGALLIAKAAAPHNLTLDFGNWRYGDAE